MTGDSRADSTRKDYAQLPSRYPLIYRSCLQPEHYPSPIAERGFECGNGWYDLIDELSAWLEGEARARQMLGDEQIPLVVQCKEKFGTLRLYVRCVSDPVLREEISERVEAARQRSERTCEQCGAPGALGNARYIRVLCPACAGCA